MSKLGSLICWVLMIISVANPAPSPATTQHGTISRFEPAPCPMTIVDGYNVICGYVVVPVEHANPTGATLRLAVAVFKTGDPTPEPDPVIFLAGGPGSNLLDQFTNGLGSLARRLQLNRDLIIFDQRGMGYSEPSLRCPEVVALYSQSAIPSQGLYGNAMVEAARKCYQRLTNDGVNVAAFNTVENAADVADIIAALGYQTYNIYAASYGTMLGFTVLRDHPQSVRSATMTAISPPQVDLMASIPSNMQNTLELLYETCQLQPACTAVYPAFTDMLAAAVSRYEHNPAEMSIHNPYSGQSTVITMSASDMVLVVYFALYSPDALPQIPLLLAALAAGDASVLAPLVEGYLATNLLLTDGALFAMRCMDDLMTTTPEAIDAALAAIDPVLQSGWRLYLGWWQSICSAGWGAHQPDPVENTPVTSNIPVLMQSGKYDPITPARWGELALETLPAGFHFTLPASGHGAVPTNCALGILSQFLDDPTHQPDASCMDGLLDTRFLTP